MKALLTGGAGFVGSHLAERLLDLGTGSGILAIAAAKLGAARVLGLEIEPIAVTIFGTVGAIAGTVAGLWIKHFRRPARQ